MRDPEKSRSRKHDSAWLAVFFAVIILGASASVTLTVLRPHFWTNHMAGDVAQPVVDNRCADFTVKYPDFYYLDLELRGEKPVTFSILDESGEPLYTWTETDFQDEAIRLKLPAGDYCYSLSYETGYHVAVSIE